VSRPDKSTEWWNLPKGQRAQPLWTWCDYVAKQNRTQRMDTRIFVEAVNNFNPDGNSDFSYALRSAMPYKIRDNILLAARDTMVAMIAQARTSPQYLTTAAEWGTSRIAERRSRVLQGQMYDLGVFQLVPRAFGDACDGGTGYVYGCLDSNGLPSLERCLHNEVYVDPEDGRYGMPERAARVRFVDRKKLLKQHPTMRAKIMEASGPIGQDYMDFFIKRSSKADKVRVVEAWQCASSEGANDGLYVKSISNCALEERKYRWTELPIVRVVFAERAQGYYGQSLTERMMPAQMRVCEIDDYIARCQKLGSSSKWFVFQNSGVTRDDITNVPDQVLDVRSPDLMPQHVVHTATPPDLLEQRREVKSDVMNQEGFGDNATTGDVNKGLSSARAVRAAHDVRSQRFINPTRYLEDAYLGVVRLIERLNDECAELDPNYAPKARYRSGRRTWLKTSRWLDLSLKEHDATVQMFPISAQATTPQGKWSSVEEWVQAGFVSKPQAMDLMEFPDTEAFEALENANYDLVHEQIDNIISLDNVREDMLLPVPEQDLALAKYVARNAMLVAFRLGAPDDVMARFDAYMAYARELEKKAKEAAAQEAAVQTPNPAALNPSAQAAAQLSAVPQVAAA